MEPVIVEGFVVTPDRGEVLRLLGSREGAARQRPERVERAIDEALRLAGDLVSPRGIYVVAAGKDLPGSDIFAALETVAFCVCTIGPALEAEVSRRSSGDLLGAVVLDSTGSVAAEAAAEHMEAVIRESAARDGLQVSCRASPGYGDWKIGDQAGLFRLVPAERIGVRLSPGMMMIPRKSVSFAVHIAKEPVRLRSENSCRNCDRGDCPFRLLE